MARLPADLKHFLIQNPGAEHDDAIDVYHRVFAAVQELGRLLFTVQDQGDILLVDAESDSVPPAKKQPARAGDGGRVSPSTMTSVPAESPRGRRRKSVLCRVTQSRAAAVRVHTTHHGRPLRSSQVSRLYDEVSCLARSAALKPGSGQGQGSPVELPYVAAQAPDANAGCGETESVGRWGDGWTYLRLLVRIARLTS